MNRAISVKNSAIIKLHLLGMPNYLIAKQENVPVEYVDKLLADRRDGGISVRTTSWGHR